MVNDYLLGVEVNVRGWLVGILVLIWWTLMAMAVWCVGLICCIRTKDSWVVSKDVV
jgi:hypothetical protein